ncbi:MAG TPA: hypothetical protein VF082_12750 [Jiangellaceae bacterium]
MTRRPAQHARTTWRQRRQDRETGQAFTLGYQAGVGDTERYYREQIEAVLRSTSEPSEVEPAESFDAAEEARWRDYLAEQGGETS